MNGREVGLFGIGLTNKRNRLRDVSIAQSEVRCMTIGTTDVVAPMFTSSKIITFLFAGMTRKTGLGNLL